MSKTYHQYCGKLGEESAKAFVQQKGWQIIVQNWRYKRLGEIDLIALDLVGEVLHFIEVKTRQCNSAQGSPLEALSPTKQHRLQHLAEAYLQEGGLKEQSNYEISIDLFAVSLMGSQIIETQLIENILN